MSATDALPFDQHYLLASIAPRYVYVRLRRATMGRLRVRAFELPCGGSGDKEAFPAKKRRKITILTCTRAALVITAVPVSHLFQPRGLEPVYCVF